MALYIGTSGYAYPKWKGQFYPAKIPAKEMLRYYSDHFRAVELNNTFYKLPPASSFEGWAADVPAGFRFAVKSTNKITHIKRLRDCEEPASDLVAAAAGAGKKLGPILFQLPPNFKADHARLEAFLNILPARQRYAFEFRHETWFAEETFALLRRHKIALCIAEPEEGPPTPHIATTDWGYLRLRREDYSSAELKKWAGFISKQNWKDTFVFFRHEDTGTGPRFAKILSKLLEPAAD